MALPVSGVVVFETKLMVLPAQTGSGFVIETVGFDKTSTFTVAVVEQPPALVTVKV